MAKKIPRKNVKLQKLKESIASSMRAYLSRRPHRSFQRTRRRDYQRSLILPGYWSFSLEVWGMLKKHKTLFAGLILTYALFGAVFIGVSSQDTYGQLSSLIDQTGGEFFTDGWAGLEQAGLLLLTSVSGTLDPNLTDVQRVYQALILLLVWLTTVWLLRAIMAGKRPRLRDGLYNAGAPIVATTVVSVVLVLQLLPATLAIIVMSSALTTNLFASGFMAMLVTILVALLILLSIYWVISTIIAMVVVTLPGMYPWQAIRTAGDIVIGRRVRLLLRMGWLSLGNLLFMVGVMLPVIMLQRWLASLTDLAARLPIVPVAFMLVTATVIVWSAAYVYILYRKVVQDDASPA